MSIWGRVPNLDEVVAKIDAVTTKGVREFAGQIVGQGKSALALYGPVQQAPLLHDLKLRLAA